MGGKEEAGVGEEVGDSAEEARRGRKGGSE